MEESEIGTDDGVDDEGYSEMVLGQSRQFFMMMFIRAGIGRARIYCQGNTKKRGTTSDDPSMRVFIEVKA